MVPQPLNGLAEQIEQIARTNCDPPLAVISRSIPRLLIRTSVI